MLSTLILSLPSIMNLAALEVKPRPTAANPHGESLLQLQANTCSVEQGLVFFVFGVLGMHLYGRPPHDIPPPAVYGNGTVIGPEVTPPRPYSCTSLWGIPAAAAG